METAVVRDGRRADRRQLGVRIAILARHVSEGLDRMARVRRALLPEPAPRVGGPGEAAVRVWQGRQRSRAVRRRPRRLGRPQCRQRRARERARALGVWQSEAQGRDRTRVRDGIRRVSDPRTCWSRVHVLQQAYRGCADQHSRSAFRGIRRQPPREHRGNLEPGRRATALRHTHPGIQVHLGRAALTLGQPQPAGVV